MEDLRQRNTCISLDSNHCLGALQPLKKPSSFWLLQLRNHLIDTFHNGKGRMYVILLGVNLVCLATVLYLSHRTNSLGLSAFNYLLLFDTLCLTTSVLSLWVEKQTANLTYTFGYERFEVLALFASTVLFHLGGLFIFKESFERMFLVTEEVETWGVGPALALGLPCHLAATYRGQPRVLAMAVLGSQSSWLQEQAAELCRAACRVVPSLSPLLLPRLNPLALLGWSGGGLALVAWGLVPPGSYQLADTVCAVVLALVGIVTMYPMSEHTGRILLQTVPGHVTGQLDKCLREASTLDGVLEFRCENFWTLAFDDLVGTVHVRIRRDANEQLVLAHLVDRLSSLVKHLTIQVFKDDWTRNAAVSSTSSTSFHLPMFPTPNFYPNGALNPTPGLPIR